MSNERPTCGAKTRKGTPCTSTRLYPNGRCRHHGGPSTGPKTWTKGGRYSKKVRAFLEHIETRAMDPQILDVREKLAFLDDVIEQLIDRSMEDRDTPKWRQRVLDVVEQANTELQAGDRVVVATMGRLLGMVREGVSRDRAMLEATALAEKRIGRTVDLRGVMVREAAAISMQQFLGFAGMTLEVVMRFAGPNLAPALINAIIDTWHGRDIHPAWQEQLAELKEVQEWRKPTKQLEEKTTSD